MICTPTNVHDLIQRVRGDDDSAVEALCRCFEPELRTASRQVDHLNNEAIEQDIRHAFILQVKNSDSEN